ncbi:hypothetical protein VCV18_012606 [Metarhizium anisopliae]
MQHTNVWIPTDDQLIENVIREFTYMRNEQLCEAEFANYATEIFSDEIPGILATTRLENGEWSAWSSCWSNPAHLPTADYGHRRSLSVPTLWNMTSTSGLTSNTGCQFARLTLCTGDSSANTPTFTMTV